MSPSPQIELRDFLEKNNPISTFFLENNHTHIPIRRRWAAVQSDCPLLSSLSISCLPQPQPLYQSWVWVPFYPYFTVVCLKESSNIFPLLTSPNKNTESKNKNQPGRFVWFRKCQSGNIFLCGSEDCSFIFTMQTKYVPVGRTRL